MIVELEEKRWQMWKLYLLPGRFLSLKKNNYIAKRSAGRVGLAEGLALTQLALVTLSVEIESAVELYVFEYNYSH